MRKKLRNRKKKEKEKKKSEKKRKEEKKIGLVYSQVNLGLVELRLG